MSAQDFFVEDSAEEDSFRENQSFRKFRDAESIVIDETDSSATVESSVGSVNSSSAASEEENLVLQMKKRQSKRMSMHPRQVENETSDDSELVDRDQANDGSDQDGDLSSEEEDEEEVERRAFSPMTRMSIHGVAAAGTTSDDDNDDNDDDSGGDGDSEDEIITTARKSRKKIIISDDENDDEATNGNESFDPSLSNGAASHVVKGENRSSTSQQDDEQQSFSTKLSSTLNSEASSHAHSDERNQSRGELSFNGGRHSISMRASIGEKLSSTHIGEEMRVQPTGTDADSQRDSVHNDSSKIGRAHV